MGTFNVIEVLASGLSAARTRVNILASNIANAETTKTEDGTPFRRRDVVQVARTQRSAFESELDRMTMAKPTIDRVVEDMSDPKKVYQPGHPDADKEGYVLYPNINVVTTMTDLMTATRLYQANVAAVQTVRDMIDAATRIQSI